MPDSASTPCRTGPAYLALADGSVFTGHSVGAPRDLAGQAVFNTAMTGYPEILSDPSYAGQFACLTAPEIGVYGLEEESLESDGFRVNGLLVHRLSPATFRPGAGDLSSALRRHGTPALSGIDTRALALRLREAGSQNAFLCASGGVPPGEGVARARAWEGLDGQDYASRVTCQAPQVWIPETGEAGYPPADRRVVVYDFGAKRSLLRAMRRQGFEVVMVPAATPASGALEHRPAGVVLSSGPGDPAGLDYAVDAVRALLGRVPVLGICLGHQILGRALGARTYRLPFGHHGANHPVRAAGGVGRTWITAQNHNYAVDAGSLLAGRAEVTHVNLNDGSVEGLRCLGAPAFSVQFHPEAGPGPNDAAGVFGQFRALVDSSRPA